MNRERLERLDQLMDQDRWTDDELDERSRLLLEFYGWARRLVDSYLRRDEETVELPEGWRRRSAVLRAMSLFGPGAWAFELREGLGELAFRGAID